MTVSSAEARRLLKEALQREAATRDTLGAPMRRALRQMAARRAQIDADEIALFDAAQSVGFDFVWIAEALDLTRQGARQRAAGLQRKRRKTSLPDPSPEIAAIVAAITTPVPGKKENPS